MYEFETIAAVGENDRRLETRNPADRDSVAGRYFASDPSRMIDVVRVAQTAQRDWAALSELQLVIGGAEIGREVVSVPGVDGITFTGSVATGKAIYRAAADNLAERAARMPRLSTMFPR